MSLTGGKSRLLLFYIVTFINPLQETVLVLELFIKFNHLSLFFHSELNQIIIFFSDVNLTWLIFNPFYTFVLFVIVLNYRGWRLYQYNQDDYLSFYCLQAFFLILSIQVIKENFF